jgi:hypothetical protein
VTVLSVMDPGPSLPLLLEALEIFPSFFEQRAVPIEVGRSAGCVGGEDFGEGEFVLDTDARRRGIWVFCSPVSTTTLDTDMDGVTAVMDGRPLE